LAEDAPTSVTLLKIYFIFHEIVYQIYNIDSNYLSFKTEFEQKERHFSQSKTFPTRKSIPFTINQITKKTTITRF